MERPGGRPKAVKKPVPRREGMAGKAVAEAGPTGRGAAPGRGLLPRRRLDQEGEGRPPSPGLVPDRGRGRGIPASMRRFPGSGGVPGVSAAARGAIKTGHLKHPAFSSLPKSFASEEDFVTKSAKKPVNPCNIRGWRVSLCDFPLGFPLQI